MTTRARAIVLDGRSLEASAAQGDRKLARVQTVIIALLNEYGGMTHDELIDAYNRRAATSEAVPYVTEQSVRTRTAELVRRGLVRASDTPGRSKHGYPSTKWVTT